MDELNKDIDINTPLSGEGETGEEENPILPEEPIKLEKPTLVNSTEEYTGNEITFEIADWDNLSQYLEITDNGDSLTQEEIGKYSVTLKFKDDTDATWVDDTTDEVTLYFEITEPKSEIEIVEWLKSKFPEMTRADLEWVYEQAVNIWLEAVFPFAYDIVEIPYELRPRATTWLKKCCMFILKMNSITEGLPLTSYSENGLSYHFDSTMLSSELLNTLPPPMVGIRGSKK